MDFAGTVLWVYIACLEQMSIEDNVLRCVLVLRIFGTCQGSHDPCLDNLHKLVLCHGIEVIGSVGTDGSELC